MTESTIHPLIEERWSPRVFKNNELNDQQIEMLFEAARWAPSSRNSQPWRFVYASKSDSVTWLKLVDCLTDFNKDWVQSASLLVLACVVKVDPSNGRTRNHSWYDLGLAVANFTFQANSQGIFVRNMGGFESDKAIGNFGIPESIEPVVMLAVGNPDEQVISHPKFDVPAKSNRKREGLDKIIFTNSWDELLW